ncbi:two-component system, NtrC family, sensor histidine kinase PilS [Andreprevotia lacus DSM 23236]|jgi:two-component system sensor histidine kinase PilS (NtrC family)|uniref:histidine kinase n=1 Tax=Andreprevotia lacus DSM 23236 TaxID=1121001 RepID=A0A1W1Y0R2_9NEIS|nr:ATP-binding protein [Andreprevotia lacus]SMC29727.1 two-component system, NtrC family, sensor histidine kinase PilS [Andreprevotia lacus DSM 23236]
MPRLHPPPSELHWRSLALLNVFRFLGLIALLTSLTLLVRRSPMSADQWPFFLQLCGAYITMALIFAVGIARRLPVFHVQLGVQVLADVLFIVGIMHLMGGIKSGLGILLLPYLAAAGLIARGRMSLFHAALASIAILLEQTWQWLQLRAALDEFLVPALLCAACFAVAWLAHRLARYAAESERLAEQRGIDLANLAQLNARILQDVSDGVLVVDRHGTIRQCNDQAVRLIGLQPAADATLPAVLPGLDLALAAWRDNPKQLPPLLQAMSRKTLRPRFVRLTASYDLEVLVYLEDMDKLRREAQQLKLAALGRLTANLAHEIRNPLGAISHAGQLLREDCGDSPLQLRLTQIINENAARLERMVRDVLELNRRDRVQMSEIRLPGWLLTFLDEVRQAEEITVTVALVCPDEAVVRFDPGHLHQVLWNLLRNGWRYCSKGPGSLAVMVSERDGRWRLDVLNDGPPVPADAQSQLFEPFFTTESKGTGLGLYIAREICAANAALLEYIPSGEVGACFRIVFGRYDVQKT